MQKHMTIINLACTITKLRKWGEAWKHSAESAQANTARLHQANKELEREKFMTAGLIDKLIADRDEAWKERDTQTADHEAKMIEHRAAFGARTVADAKLIAGLREERNGLLTQVQDMREEIIRVNDAHGRTIVERDALRAEVADLRGIVDMVHASLGIKRGDHIGNAIAQLKAQTPKRSHPVAVGEYLRRLTGFSTTPAGEVAQVLHVDCDAPTTEYTVKRPNGQQGVWSESGCEPCDPPNHDTEAGKAAAEAALKSESVTDIKVGDLCEVVSNRGRNTWLVDVGSLGIVTSVEDINDSISVHLDDVPGKKNALAGYVSFCDVRKVTT